METRTDDINFWLKSEDSNTDVLAICGMGGSGKTTLAQYIYNLNKHNFECSSFLEEVGKHCKQPYGLLGLQKRLLTDILEGKNEMVSCVFEGTKKIEETLRMKRALIVLDDIDEHDELGSLLGTNMIHTKNKIIITTRLLDIQAWFGSSSWRCRVHKLKLLNDHESLEVLSCHAFGSKIPMEGFSDLAVELAQYCGGNPLALKVLGSSLFVGADNLGERNSIIEVWRSRLNSLNSLKGDLDSKIQGILRKSFDSLQLRSHKELFLHIAIFFVGEDEDYVVKILEHDLQAKAGILTLINRCLLTVSPNKKLVMHQLLQDMGRNIVREESKDPAKQTRVWCSDEAYHLLTKGEGSETIEGLAFDTRKLKKGTKVLSIKTGSLAKMDKLKLLQLKYVELTGTYKHFPELRWLSWHGCHFKTIPSAFPMCSLVSLDMTNGNLKVFEPPMVGIKCSKFQLSLDPLASLFRTRSSCVCKNDKFILLLEQVLNSLKFVNLHRCYQLVSIRNLSRLPNLETLILRTCTSLTHVCETIGGLKSLALLNLKGCKKLWKVLLKHKFVKHLGGVPEQPFLPQSLKFLFLDYCDLEYNSDVSVVFQGQSLFGLSLRRNPFEFLPNNIDLKMLRVLNLSFCGNLKSILCLPCTLEELYTYECKSLEKVTFESARFRLRKFGYRSCFNLSEIEGLFKLVSIEKLDEADLGHMKWIKAYQDHKVDLVGDEITKGRIWHIQMLYEYGVMSTYLQGMKDQSMFTHEHTSSSNYLSFGVPMNLKTRRIKGLNVTTLYRSSGSKDKDRWCVFAKIKNKTKGVTWIYSPVVYCKPKVDQDVVWLSYWPVGYMLDAGDEVLVDIIVERGLDVSWCGASIVIDGEVKQEENWDNNKKLEEVIGGDLSEFKVSPGVYYLCRRDFFKSNFDSYTWVKRLIGGTVPHTELQGWRKSHQSEHIDASCMQLTLPMELYTDSLYKEIWLGYFNSESDICKIKKMVSRLEGVDYVVYLVDERKLVVSGCVDCMAVETCVREFQKNVAILDVYYVTERLLEHCHKKIAIWKGDKNKYEDYIFWHMLSTRKKFF